jgi:hypothetical protein
MGHHRARLTDKEVIEMRTIYNESKERGYPLSYASLGIMFDCGDSTARDIVQYRTRLDVCDGFNLAKDYVKEPDVFDEAESNRQKILDELNKVSRSTSKDIANATGFGIDHVYRSLCKMAELGEVEKHGKNKGVYFIAVAKTTHPAKVLRDKANNVRETNKQESLLKRPKPSKGEPWRTVNIAGDRPPIKGQGGQGAVRHHSWARATGSVS